MQYALAVGQSSRLTRSLVFEQEIAVGVSVDWQWRFDPGSFTVVIELKPEGDPKKAETSGYEEEAGIWRLPWREKLTIYIPAACDLVCFFYMVPLWLGNAPPIRGIMPLLAAELVATIVLLTGVYGRVGRQGKRKSE